MNQKFFYVIGGLCIVILLAAMVYPNNLFINGTFNVSGIAFYNGSQICTATNGVCPTGNGTTTAAGWLTTTTAVYNDTANINVGIGTSSPTTKLDVRGSVNVSGKVNASQFNGSIDCKYLTGGSDADFCADTSGGGGSGSVQIPAANVSSGTFGVNASGGNYAFKNNLTVGNLTVFENLSLGALPFQCTGSSTLDIIDGLVACGSDSSGGGGGQSFDQNLNTTGNVTFYSQNITTNLLVLGNTNITGNLTINAAGCNLVTDSFGKVSCAGATPSVTSLNTFSNAVTISGTSGVNVTNTTGDIKISLDNTSLSNLDVRQKADNASVARTNFNNLFTEHQRIDGGLTVFNDTNPVFQVNITDGSYCDVCINEPNQTRTPSLAMSFNKRNLAIGSNGNLTALVLVGNKDVGFNHGITSLGTTETREVAFWSNNDPKLGGSNLLAFTNMTGSASITALNFLAVAGSSNQDDAVPVINFVGIARSGSTLTVLGPNETVVGMANAVYPALSVMTIKGDGNFSIKGCTQPTADFYIGGTGAGCATGTWSKVNRGAALFSVSSSEKIKENFADINTTNASRGLAQIRPVKFDFKSYNETQEVEQDYGGIVGKIKMNITTEIRSETTYGFRAEDVYLAFKDDPNYMGNNESIDYQFLFVYQVATTQELQKRLEKLENPPSIIDTILAAIDDLRLRVTTLERNSPNLSEFNISFSVDNPTGIDAFP